MKLIFGLIFVIMLVVLFNLSALEGDRLMPAQPELVMAGR